MPFLKKFFQAIGHFFENLFHESEKVWDKLQPKVQDAILAGTGIVDFINKNKDGIPAMVKTLLIDAFPNLTEEEIQSALAEVSKTLNLATDIAQPTLEELIAAVQVYLKSKTGAGWANASDTIAKTIAIFLAPKETKASAILSLIVFAYQKFIKK